MQRGDRDAVVERLVGNLITHKVGSAEERDIHAAPLERGRLVVSEEAKHHATSRHDLRHRLSYQLIPQSSFFL
jgi:hypothetical protein